MNILVDTSVWSHALRRDTPSGLREVHRLRQALEGGAPVFSTGLILQELLQGFQGAKARQKIIRTFAALPFIIPETRDHIDAADLKTRLRRKGVQAGTIDVLLAQLCLRHELSMLTLDDDFAHIARHCALSLV
jgi:predicted nucleic acid-binding protein